MLTDRVKGVFPRLNALEDKCFSSKDSLEIRVRALEDKLANMKEGDNVVFETDPETKQAQQKLETQFKTSVDILTTMEKDIKSNTSRILMNTAQLLCNNVKISGIPYSENENPSDVVKKFLEDKMGLKIQPKDIYDAFRLKGTISVYIRGVKVWLPPQMFVRCAPPLAREIDRNKRILDKKTDPTDGHFYKVRIQTPDAYAAAKTHYNDIVQEVMTTNEGKPQEERTTFTFRGTELLLNDIPVTEPVLPPPRTAILNIPEDKQRAMDEIPLVQLSEARAKRSGFYGYAVRAYTTDYINLAYLKMRQMHPTANHIMAAYRLETPETVDDGIHGSCNDGKSHSDVKLSEALAKTSMTGVVVFVVRYYGGIQLRGLRLKLIVDCAKNALYKLRFPEGIQPGTPEKDPTKSSQQVMEQDSETELADSETDRHNNPTSSSRAEHSYSKNSFSIRGGYGPGGKGKPRYQQRGPIGTPQKKTKLSNFKMSYMINDT